MAEQVQAILDRMVPALRDLMERGIFSESEIKEIVRRRRDSEYLTRRLSPRKSDYLRYIEAEKNLEKLRVLRKKMVSARQEAKDRENLSEADPDNKQLKGNTKGSIGDASVVQNIHLLYVRAKRKWKDDLTWHMQHAEFAKEVKSYQQLSKIYAEALQIHPRNESLWIEAASHEYFGYKTNEDNEGMSGGGSIKNARVLLQRGLRINADSQALWLQSFCLELHYIQKLKGRREILQLENNDHSQAEGTNNDDEENSSTLKELCENLMIPRIIYKNAIKAIPNDSSFRMQFIEQCKLFPRTEALVDDILESIEKDFQNVEDSWISRASYILDNKNCDAFSKSGFLLTSGNVETDEKETTRKRKRGDICDEKNLHGDEVLNILDAATDAICTPKMFCESVSFLRMYIEKLSNYQELDQDEAIAAKGKIGKVIQFAVSLINKADSKVTPTPELAIEMVICLTEFGLTTNALNLLERLMNQNSPCQNDAKCWLKRAELADQIDVETTGKSTLKATCKILRKATSVIPLHDSGHLEILIILFMSLLKRTTFQEQHDYDDDLASTYDKILLLSHQNKRERYRCDTSIPDISLSYLRYASSKGGTGFARLVYNKFLFGSNYCNFMQLDQNEIETMKEFFDECTIIEKDAEKSSNTNRGQKKMQRQIVRKIYDSAYNFFQMSGNDVIADSYRRERNEHV